MSTSFSLSSCVFIFKRTKIVCFFVQSMPVYQKYKSVSYV